MRECGDCVVCCTYLSIQQIDKPGLSHCQHCTITVEREGELCYSGLSKSGNCRLHRYDKPEPCSGYRCLWLRGFGEEEDRPDRCGMLIDTVKPIDNCIQAKALWPGAHNEPAGQVAVERMSRQTNRPALVAGFPETHMVRVVGRGPEEW